MGNKEAYHHTCQAADNSLQGNILQFAFQLDNDIPKCKSTDRADSAPEGTPCNLSQNKVTCRCCYDYQNNLNDNVQEAYSL